MSLNCAYLFQVPQPGCFLVSRLCDQCYGQWGLPVARVYDNSQRHVGIPTVLIDLGCGGTNIEDYIYMKISHEITMPQLVIIRVRQNNTSFLSYEIFL